MSASDVLTLYDREERFGAPPGDGVREVTPHVVRHVRPVGRESFVGYVSLDGADADAVIRDEIAYFGATGRSFEWKYFDHDRPADLLRRLRRAGFAIGEEEVLVAFELDAPSPLVQGALEHDVRRADAGPERDAFRAVLAATRPEHAGRILDDLARQREADPAGVETYVGYLDAEPATAGWLVLTEGSSFAGLYGGATVPHARRRGLYRALVAARVRAAHARGRRFATVDAGPMSRPVLERLGFVRLASTRPCIWSPGGG